MDEIFEEELQSYLDNVVNDTKRFTPEESIELWERVRDYAYSWAQTLREENGL